MIRSEKSFDTDHCDLQSRYKDKEMLRSEVNNQLLALFESPSYLEIGVASGETFNLVRAARKCAVDPHFAFSYKDLIPDPHVRYFEVESNTFFLKLNPSEKFDLIFLDGLHTFEQTLTDLLNSMFHLTPDGVIVIDDVLPTSFSAALRTQGEAHGFRLANNDPSSDWMGDVFRLVFFIEAFFQGFDFYTVLENHGQLIMWRSGRLSLQNKDLTIMDIALKTYYHSICERLYFRIKPFEEIFELAKARSMRPHKDHDVLD